jgi:hypothetical protein
MSKQLKDRTSFLTRQQAADMLLLSPHQDRLVKAGELKKVKLSASRSGIPRSHLER